MKTHDQILRRSGSSPARTPSATYASTSVCGRSLNREHTSGLGMDNDVCDVGHPLAQLILQLARELVRLG